MACGLKSQVFISKQEDAVSLQASVCIRLFITVVLIRATDSRFSRAGRSRTPLLSLIVTSHYTTLEFHSPCDQEWQLDLHVAGYLV